MHTLLTTTTETTATALQYVKRPDRANTHRVPDPSTLVQTLVYGWLSQPTATMNAIVHLHKPDPH